MNACGLPDVVALDRKQSLPSTDVVHGCLRPACARTAGLGLAGGFRRALADLELTGVVAVRRQVKGQHGPILAPATGRCEDESVAEMRRAARPAVRPRPQTD